VTITIGRAGRVEPRGGIGDLLECGRAEWVELVGLRERQAADAAIHLDAQCREVGMSRSCQIGVRGRRIIYQE
jgi:pyrimidine operon attenuation protein/uracil phosphoribosyltransferase